MSTYVHQRPAEPNDALGLILIAMIVAFMAAGVYYCSVNSYKWGPAIVVPPQYESVKPGINNSSVLPRNLPDGG
jgi:hypothetical protein